MPKKTNGGGDLRRDGGESLLRNLGKIVGLIMQEAHGEKLAMIAWIACLGKWRVVGPSDGVFDLRYVSHFHVGQL